MNRDQRRAMEKALRKAHGKAVTRTQARQTVKTVNAFMDAQGLKEGDRVKIDYDAMCTNGQWTGTNEKYRQFVEDNKDRVFTIERPTDPKRPSAKNLEGIFQFAEDPSEVKWLFWVGHLKKVGEEDEVR